MFNCFSSFNASGGGTTVTNLDFNCTGDTLTLSQSDNNDFSVDLSCLKSEISSFTIDYDLKEIYIEQTNANQNDFSIDLNPLFSGITIDRYITQTINGQGGFIISGDTGTIAVPYASTVTSWFLTSNVTASTDVVVKINGVTQDTISLSAQTNNTGVVSWAFSANSIFTFEVNPTTNFEFLQITLKV